METSQPVEAKDEEAEEERGLKVDDLRTSNGQKTRHETRTEIKMGEMGEERE